MRRKKGSGIHGGALPQYRPYKTAVLAGGCAVLAVALLTVLRVGSPIRVRHMLCLPAFFPPTWLLLVCGGFSYLMMGGLLGRGGWCLCSARYLPVRGLLFLVGFTFLRLCWYPVFFGLIAPLSACGVLVCALCLGIGGCILLGRRLGRLWPIMLCQMGWCGFLLVNSLAVFFLN